MAVAARLLEDGWGVALASRTGRRADSLADKGVSTFQLDRCVPGQLEDALGAGADVLIDIAAFTAENAKQVNALADRLGSARSWSSRARLCTSAPTSTTPPRTLFSRGRRNSSSALNEMRVRPHERRVLRVECRKLWVREAGSEVDRTVRDTEDHDRLPYVADLRTACST
jgi:NAD(P)-dependent dehydrogenase (short-subunit alcohol dehydrogenase family)